MFAREASDAQAEGSSEPDVELGPALDEAAAPGEELTTVGRGDRRQGLHKAGVDLLAAMVRHQQWGRRAMGGQCRGGNRPGSHTSSLVSVVCGGSAGPRPKARR